MNKQKKPQWPIGVAVALFVLILPWRPLPIERYLGATVLALVISLVGYALLQWGLRYFAGPQHTALKFPGDPDANLSREAARELWRAMRLSVVAALVVEIGGVSFGRSSLVSPMTAFFVTLAGQQLVFVGSLLLIALKLSPDSRFGARVVTVFAVIVLSIICAVANNPGFFTYGPNAAASFPDSEIWPFLIPALVAGLVGLLCRYRIEHR